MPALTAVRPATLTELAKATGVPLWEVRLGLRRLADHLEPAGIQVLDDGSHVQLAPERRFHAAVAQLVQPQQLPRLSQEQPGRLGQAFEHYCRIAKTFHLLAVIDDEGYRRRMSSLINIHEERHRLARKGFHGHRGQLRQRYREGQEDQLGALGLVLNAVVLWTTRRRPRPVLPPATPGW